MTSCNYTNYNIYDLNGKHVGQHLDHWYCKPHWNDLLEFSPPENYTIEKVTYDEEENEYYEDPISLKEFLQKRKII
jgi:hypothetical protein